MSEIQYATLAEAFGSDFASQVNQKDKHVNPLHVSRSQPGSLSQRGHNRLEAFENSQQDVQNLDHGMRDNYIPRNSMAPQWNHQRTKHIYPWGEEQVIKQPDELDDLSPMGDIVGMNGSSIDTISPSKALRRSLVSDHLDRTVSGYPPHSVGELRVRTNSKPPPGMPTDYRSVDGSDLYTPYSALAQNNLESIGYAGPVMTYGPVEPTACKSYFHHLDHCKKCQRKLKKRVIRYFRAMQHAKEAPMLPGSRGMEHFSPEVLERELFSDRPEDDDSFYSNRSLPSPNSKPQAPLSKEKTQNTDRNVKEDFGNRSQSNLTPTLLLLVFGLLVIFAMDSSRKSIRSGLTKMVQLV